jgi:DMSO/TMAO reductase YedYZ molybdopterin-dependent catalytic subunit
MTFTPQSSSPPSSLPPKVQPSTAPSAITRWWSALAGIVSVIAGLGAAEITAGFVAPGSSPLFVAGSLVIDLVPGWVKDTVIAVFGTGDKLVLLITLAVLVAALAGVAGLVERFRPPWGRAMVAIVGLVAVVAALSRSAAGPLAAVPSLVAILISVAVLGWLTKRLSEGFPQATAVSAAAIERNRSVGRRRFLITAGTTAGAGVLAIFAGRMLMAGRQATQAVRTAFKLPAPAVPVTAIPAGTSFDIPGLAPLVTPNEQFYRIDTALQVPAIDPKDWTLKIYGMVDNEVTINFEELVALPLEESYTSLTCVSNYVGGNLIGNAKWLGYPIRELLKKAGPHSGADMVLSTSIDGFTASSPIAALSDDRNAILAIGMNDEPLPLEHGYPVRMVVPGLYGYVSATKWVTQLEVTTFAKHAAYWTERGWSSRGPVKLSSRIDVPRDGGGSVKEGSVVVAGVAWAQHTGISRVQVRVDDGPWNDAELAEAISADTWRQWKWNWPARSGHHVLTVRATDANSTVQIASVADVIPDGATGLHSINVTVS